MKKILMSMAVVLTTLAATAQTLNITVDNVTYQFPASQAGEMTFSDGTKLTVMGKAFTISDITSMYTDETSVTDFQVGVVYSTSGDAQVTIPGNVAQYVSATVSGNTVTLTQSSDYAGTDYNGTSDEITYQLSGESSNGSLTLGGSYKCTISLAGVTLTNPSGAAIYVTNSKRIQLSAKKNTTNTITDGASGSQKAAIYSKGQLQLQGNGTLNVVGNTKHGIKSASYISIKNLTLNITSTVSDGINCEEYIQMKSGTVTISGVGDDGIQCDLGDATNPTTVTEDHEDEDTGNIYLEGGTLTVTVPNAATAGKCIKAAGDLYLTGGTITANANGAIDLSDTSDPSYTAGLKADGSVILQGATATVNVNGAAGRGVGATTFTSTSGTLTVTNKGATSSSGSSYFCTAKGIKAGVVNISGGTIDVTMSGAASKGIKADIDDGEGTMTISGGTITVSTTGAAAYNGTTDSGSSTVNGVKGCAALSADSNIAISGGTLTLSATGSGGKGISGDGTLTVSDNANITATTTGAIAYYSSNSIKTTTEASETIQKMSDYLKTSPKAIKCDGAMTISGGTITASASYHEGIETKSTLKISGGYIYAYSGDDAINSSSTTTITGGYIFANSSGNDAIDSNGNMTISGGTVVAVGASGAEVAIDVIENGTLTINGGNIVAIGGLENTNNVTGTCYQASSYSKGSWYGFYNNSGTLITAFKVPSNSSMGTPMVVYTSTGTPSLKSGVTGSGTSYWNGYGYSSCSGGSSVTLSSYSNSSSGGGGTQPGGNQGGGNQGGGNQGGGSGPGGQH